ncbi:MAG: FCD domain-containing protein [Streptosporangiales bacterium]|nr:FCD domain-containing protein [Streptosporangiales bacterium]
MSSRSDLVAEAIRTAILGGQLKPGATLVERRLAAQLGVSKTPVREALIRLARSGLVSMNPNRGVTVRDIDVQELRAVYEVRLQLEPWSVARATEQLTTADIQDAKALLREARREMRRKDYGALTLVNRRFHRALYARCGNHLVVSILDDLQDQLALGIVSVLWHKSPTWAEETEEHEAIFQAAARRDGIEAADLMRTHIDRSLHRMDDWERSGS